MTETPPALINYTVETFSNDRDMEFHCSRLTNGLSFPSKAETGRPEENHRNEDLEQGRQGHDRLGI